MNDIVRKSLLRDLGIDKLPEDQQIELLVGIGKIIYEAVFMRVMETLDQKKRDEFAKILEHAKTDTEILTFLEENVSDVEKMIKEEVEKFKTESLSFMKKLG